MDVEFTKLVITRREAYERVLDMITLGVVVGFIVSLVGASFIHSVILGCVLTAIGIFIQARRVHKNMSKAMDVMTDAQKRSLKAVERMFSEMDDAEFLATYEACEQGVGPKASDYLKGMEGRRGV